MQYSDKVRAYFSRPAPAAGTEFQGAAGAPEQGTWIVFGADARNGKLANVGFRAFACPHIIAACQRVVEQLEGAPIGALQRLETDKLQEEFKIPVEKAGKLLILKDALSACGENAARAGEQ